jgi:glycosyltransferase involved in cell wall biosynthesis
VKRFFLAFWYAQVTAQARQPLVKTATYSSIRTPEMAGEAQAAEHATMRIVHFVEDLNLGGLERMALDLARQQKVAGHSVWIYCLYGRGSLAEKAEATGITVRSFGKKTGFSVRVLLRIAESLRSDRPDVVNTHNPGVHHYAALAAKIAGVPAVISTRHSARMSTGEPYQERYFRWTLPLTAHVVYVSNSTREGLGKSVRVPTGKASVIHNGIPTESYRLHAAALGSRFPRVRFGTLGRMVPAKAHSVLLEAFAQVSRQIPQAELRIGGSGPLQDEVRTRIHELGLDGRATVLGATDDVAGFLGTLDIFVLSSVSEGLPLVILEAMAAGLPIVSTNVGGISEVAPEGLAAWYCEPGDAAALAHTMLEAARSPRLKEMGRFGAAHAAAEYDVGIMTAKYEQLYSTLLERKSRS